MNVQRPAILLMTLALWAGAAIAQDSEGERLDSARLSAPPVQFGELVLPNSALPSALGADEARDVLDRARGTGDAEVVAALEALGYSSREGRDAARAAVAALPAEASLEDRVKEALGSLRQ